MHQVLLTRVAADTWLEDKFNNEVFTGKFQHLSDVIESLNLHPTTSKIVTIAGSNGKGETARTLGEICLQGGTSYCLWTSPHLESVCERFISNGEQVSDEKLLKLFQSVFSIIEEKKYSLSYYEFLFITFLYFAKDYSDSVLILEVGLGGRLDATNSLNADICAITSICREHTEFLGPRYDGILLEKLGITRAGCELVTAFELDYLKGKTRAFAFENNLSWTDLCVGSKLRSFSEMNRAVALELYRKLKPKAKINLELVESTAQRGEVCFGASVFILYPSHNLEGLRKLVQFLNITQYNQYDKCILSFSKRPMKDLEGMCEILLNYFGAQNVLLQNFEHFKAVDNKQLKVIADKYSLKIINDEMDFAKKFKKISSTNLVCGSNYFLSSFIKQFKSRSCS